MREKFLPIAALLCTCVAQSQSPRATPVGRWKTVNEVSGKATSIVAIYEENGKLYGRIEKLLNQDPNKPEARCNHCEGDLKDKPVVGLRLLYDFRPDGAQWSGGRIVDPDNGKAYKCILALEDGGKKLKVRGYIGFSMLGRTQYWLPEE